jgi:hypothetical protein
MRLVVQQAATGSKREVEVPDEGLTEAALAQAVARQLALPLARLRLVRGGAALTDATARLLADGDAVVAVVAPPPPPAAILQRADDAAGASAAAADDDEEEEPLRVRLAANAPAWQRRLAAAAREKGGASEGALALALAFGWRRAVGVGLWAAASSAAAARGLGPIFILATVFALILFNLNYSGVRREGSLSAYSLFNPGLRRLPGEVTAEALDGQLRRGQMG